MRASHVKPYGSRLLAGNPVKIKALNVTHSVPSSPYQNFPLMWTVWPWDSFIKPQIDKAIALGVNTVKVCCDAIPGELASQGGTWPDDATLFSRIKQFCGYAQRNGLWVYWNFASSVYWDSNPAATTAGIAAMTKVAGWLERMPNVIALDVANEINNNSVWGSGNYAGLRAGIAPVFSALRQVTSLPLTCSIDAQTVAEYTGGYTQALAPLIDFHDFHPYYLSGDPVNADLTALRAAPYYKGRFLIGEIGQNQAASTAAQTSRMTSVGAISSAAADCYGAVAFSVVDYLVDTPNNQWGFYDQNGLNARTALTVPFAAWTGKL